MKNTTDAEYLKKNYVRHYLISLVFVVVIYVHMSHSIINWV